ncbi:TIGR03545 family protein, partial [bacterium]
NLFETGRVAFAMDFGQLLRGKTIIETMEVNNLILGTRRTTDGSLPRSRRESASNSFIGEAVQTLDRSVRNAPVFDLEQLRRQFNIDSLLNVQKLETLHHLDSLKTAVLEASKQWDAALVDLEKSKQRAAQIEAEVRAIDVNQLNSVDKITQAISAVENAYKGINEIKQTVDNRRSTITGQVSGLASSVGQIDDVVKQDIARVMRLARLPDLSAKGIAELLLGKEIFSKAAGYLYWVDWARANVPKYLPKPDKESPPRLKGQDIHFPEERSYPKMWIKQILISGGTDQEQDPEYIRAKGKVLNISSNQRISGAPLTVDLAGSKGGKLSLTLGALFDRRAEVPLDEYKASASGLRLADFKLGQSDFLPSRINGAGLNAELEIRVPGNAFDSRANLHFSNLQVVFDTAARNLGERLAREVLGSIKGFDADVRVWNPGSGMDIALATNLDALIASRLKDVAGAEITRLQNEMKAKVEAKIAAKRAEAEKIFAQKRQEAEQKVKGFETAIGGYLASVDAKEKELKDRLEKLKKGALEELGKGLFKKKK